MSQIPEAFQGHDLTGWTWLEQSVCRLTTRGISIAIKHRGFEFSIYGVGFVYSGCLSEMLELADKFAGEHGGWAPAPIGYEPSGWRPIETYTPAPSSFLGANMSHKWAGECYWSEICQEFYACGAPIKLTHWMPLPQPPQEGQG